MEFEMDCIENMLRNKSCDSVKEWESICKTAFPKGNLRSVDTEVLKSTYRLKINSWSVSLPSKRNWITRDLLTFPNI